VSLPSGRVVLLLLGALTIGVVLRAWAFVTFPIVHDEIRVMGYGLARSFLSGQAAELSFRAPATISNGVTPLWFWIQAVPAAALGETSRFGLRAVPFLLGIVGILLTFRMTLRLHNLRSAWLHFRDERVAWRACLWPSLILLTYLGKGLLVWSGYALILTVFHVRGWSDPSLSQRRRAARCCSRKGGGPPSPRGAPRRSSTSTGRHPGSIASMRRLRGRGSPGWGSWDWVPLRWSAP
jgi:hypothetical protein